MLPPADHDPLEQPLEISVRPNGPAVVVNLRGSAGMEEGEQLGPKLTSLISADAPHLILDLSELLFISSLGIGAILAAHAEARKAGGGVRLVRPRPAVQRLLTLTRIDQLLPTDATLDAAVRATAG
jgi:anti-sigma B factor antagonist